MMTIRRQSQKEEIVAATAWGNERLLTYFILSIYSYSFSDFFPLNDILQLYSSFLPQRANKVIKAHNSSTPLFLYMAFQNVHAPLQAPKRYSDKYSFIKDEKRRMFAGMVDIMDEAIGNISQAMKDAGYVTRRYPQEFAILLSSPRDFSFAVSGFSQVFMVTHAARKTCRPAADLKASSPHSIAVRKKKLLVPRVHSHQLKISYSHVN